MPYWRPKETTHLAQDGSNGDANPDGVAVVPNTVVRKQKKHARLNPGPNSGVVYNASVDGKPRRQRRRARRASGVFTEPQNAPANKKLKRKSEEKKEEEESAPGSDWDRYPFEYRDPWASDSLLENSSEPVRKKRVRRRKVTTPPPAPSKNRYVERKKTGSREKSRKRQNWQPIKSSKPKPQFAPKRFPKEKVREFQYCDFCGFYLDACSCPLPGLEQPPAPVKVPKGPTLPFSLSADEQKLFTSIFGDKYEFGDGPHDHACVLLYDGRPNVTWRGGF